MRLQLTLLTHSALLVKKIKKLIGDTRVLQAMQRRKISLKKIPKSKSLFFFAVMLLSSGCGGIMSQFAGEWGQFSENRNDVTAIETGMRSTEVLPKIGKPAEIRDGENIYAGWQEWVYPSGSLLLYRGEVRSVHALPRTAETMAKLKEANSKGFEWKFEGDKKENKISDDELAARREAAMWGERKSAEIKKTAEKNKYNNMSIEGFSSLKK